MLDYELVKSRLGGEDTGNEKAETHHVLALDGVRGLAILAVLGDHLLISNNVSASVVVQMLLDIRELLWVGVTLFFSLSGFLITGILFDTLGSENYFRTFFGRRSLRIFPLYYGVLLGLLLLTYPLHLEWNGQAWRLLTLHDQHPIHDGMESQPVPLYQSAPLLVACGRRAVLLGMAAGDFLVARLAQDLYRHPRWGWFVAWVTHFAGNERYGTSRTTRSLGVWTLYCSVGRWRCW